MGVVWAAWDPRLDRKVALKILRTAAHGGPALRMWREARALARINHANVVTVHDIDATDDCVFVAMELVDGVTLRRWTETRSGDWRAIVAAYRDAARGLLAAHALGIVHRDFKPDNVLVDGRDHVRVVDFGLVGFGAVDVDVATPSPDERESPAPLTRAGAFLGTPGYTAPEQLRGAPPHPAADQFSFCVSLFEALFGYRPFDSKMLARMSASDDELPPPPIPPGHRIPQPIVDALLRGLRVEPEQRFPSLAALVDALDGGRARRRRRWLLLLAMLAVVAGSLAAWRLLARTRRHVETTQSLARGCERLRSSLREVRLLPLHDMSRERQALRHQLALLQERLPSPDDAPVDVAQAMGLGHLELGELDAALGWLEAAWQKGAQTPESAETLGELLARLYERPRSRSVPLPPGERARQADLVETRVRQPALRYLQIARAALSGAARLRVEARIAELDGQLDRASTLATQAAASDGDASLPLALQARLAVARAWEANVDTAAVAALATSVQAWHARIAALSRSDEELYEAAAQDLTDVVLLALAREWLPRPTIDAALSACAAATRADGDSRARLSSARLHRALAAYHGAHGGDERPELAAAANDARAYLSRRADDVEARELLATILARRAQLELAAQNDPRPLLQEVMRLAGDSEAARELAVEAAATMASYDQRRGLPARDDYARGAALAGRADLLTLRPRAELAFADASWRRVDVAPALSRAARDLERAMRLEPKDALVLREQAWLDFLRWRLARRHGDAAAERRRAEASSALALTAAGQDDVTLDELYRAAELARARPSPAAADNCRRALSLAPRALATAYICAPAANSAAR
jgi:hypothetical protein